VDETDKRACAEEFLLENYFKGYKQINWSL